MELDMKRASSQALVFLRDIFRELGCQQKGLDWLQALVLTMGSFIHTLCCLCAPLQEGPHSIWAAPMGK